MQPWKPGCAPRTLKFARVASLIDVICPWPSRWRALLWMKWRVIDRRNLPLTLSLEGICPWPSHWKALLWMKWMPDIPPLPPPRYPWERGQLHSLVSGMLSTWCYSHSRSTCAFSDGDFFNALADEDFDLLQLTEEERAEIVAVVNQEGNDTTYTTGESIFHVYIALLNTSYVDRGKHSLAPPRADLYHITQQKWCHTSLTVGLLITTWDKHRGRFDHPPSMC